MKIKKKIKKVRKGFFEELFGYYGKILDEIYTPLIDLRKHLFNIVMPIIEALLFTLNPEDLRIRLWLYQKQMYFGW